MKPSKTLNNAKVKRGKGVSKPSIDISSTVNTGEYHKVYFDSYYRNYNKI